MKCSKCRSKNLYFTELWKDHSIEFDIVDGKLEGYSMEPGYPYKVEATCKECGHSWRLRGITQITELKQQ